MSGTPKLGRPELTEEDQRLIKALSHPIRAQALTTLNARVASPKEIADELEADVKDVAYHVRVLERLNCVELVKEGKARGATEHFYRGIAKQYLDVDFWSRLSEPVRNGISLTALRVLIGSCREAVDAQLFDKRMERHASVVTYNLDDQGWKESMTLLDSTLDRLMEIGVEAEERRARSDESGSEVIRTTFGLLGFESPSTKSS